MAVVRKEHQIKIYYKGSFIKWNSIVSIVFNIIQYRIIIVNMLTTILVDCTSDQFRCENVFDKSKNILFFAGRILIKTIAMARVCDITGKKVITGHNVSHSNIKTKRKFYPNLQEKKFFIPESNKWITLKVSADAIRMIDKKGISACLKEAEAKGFIKIK